MKKVLFFATALAALIVLGSCGASKSPSTVAEKAVECLKNKDFVGYVEYLEFKADQTKSKEELESAKAQYAGMLQSKYEASTKESGAMKDFKVLSEDVQDSVATVKMAINYENKADTTDIKLKLTKEGDWKIDGDGK